MGVALCEEGRGPVLWHALQRPDPVQTWRSFASGGKRPRRQCSAGRKPSVPGDLEETCREAVLVLKGTEGLGPE